MRQLPTRGPRTRPVRTSGRSAQGLLFALILGSLPSATGAQSLIPMPKNGAAYKFERGPSIVVRLVLAKDGSGEKRLILDDKTPGILLSSQPISGGTRFQMALPIDDPILGKFTIESELDAIAITGTSSYSLTPRVTKVAPSVAVKSIGVELQLLDGPRTESLAIPTFSGGEFDEPASTIPLGQTIERAASHSMQMTAYYGQDGTGLLVFSEDPRGTKPKRLVFGSSLIGVRKAFQMAIEYEMPNAHLGGIPRSAPVPTRLHPYDFDFLLEKGWFRAGKIYRSWLEENATGQFGILEMGRFEDRKDVPQWCKEIDLLLSEQFGWYQTASQVAYPLLHLRRLKTELGLDNVLVGLWFSGDKTTPLGRAGTWLPDPGAVAQFLALKTDGIRFAGYTIPGAFDPNNPLYGAMGFDQHTMEDRNGVVRTDFGGLDANGKPIILNRMDVAATQLWQWYLVLGLYHSAYSGYSGFYSDLPATVGIADWLRPPNMDIGVTEEAYLGYRAMLEMTKIGASMVNEDFVQFHEAAFEWLVPTANFGQGAVGTVGRAYKDDTNTRGIPLFQAVYSGYTHFGPADGGFGAQTLLFVPDAYGPSADDNMTGMLAEGFTWGAVLNCSEPWLAAGHLFWEVPGPQDYLDAMLHHKKALKNLVALRDLARPWLGYGEMLGSPVVEGDESPIVVKKFFEGSEPVDQTFQKLIVPTTAWKAKDGSIRVVAANGSTKPAKVMVSLERLGFRKGKGLRDTQTKEEFAVGKNFTVEVTVMGGTGRLLEIIEG